MKQFLNSKIHQVYALVALLFIVKLCLLPFAQTVHADAATRVILSLNWMEGPSWLSTSVWAPIHLYLNGFFLGIWNNPIYTPKLLNITISCLTLIPFFYFVRREFNENGALIATIFLAISPVIFRNSFQALAGTPYLFFVALAMNWLSKGLQENRSVFIIIAGLAITLAGGFRYEAWLISSLLWLVILWKRKWFYSFYFGIPAVIFPVVWVLANWVETGNPLHGIGGNHIWTLDVMDNNASLDFEAKLRRLWFWPFSFFIAMGAPTAYYTVKMIFKSYKNNPSVAMWTIPFWLFFAFMIYNSFVGTLVLQHRFVASLVILGLPFIALYFHDLSRKYSMRAWLFGILTVALSFIYNTGHVTPLPRLQDQSAVTIAKLVDLNTDPSKSGLILDFIGWENTYFIALNSGLRQSNMQIIEGATNSQVPIEGIKKVVSSFSEGLIILGKNSELSNLLGDKLDLSVLSNSQVKFETSKIYSDERTALYIWRKVN